MNTTTFLQKGQKILFFLPNLFRQTGFFSESICIHPASLLVLLSVPSFYCCKSFFLLGAGPCFHISKAKPSYMHYIEQAISNTAANGNKFSNECQY